MRRVLLLTTLIFFGSISNAQVRTNFNNNEEINARGKFKKNYTFKRPYHLPRKDIKALFEKELLENSKGEAKPFRIAEAILVLS